MYKIGIDARLYSQTGIGVYLKNLLHYLEQISRDLEIFVYLLQEDYERLTFTNKLFQKRRANYKWHTFSEQLSFVKLLYQDSLDLIHFTYFSYPVLYKKRFISTIHDVTPLLFKTGKASTKNSLLFKLKHQAFRFVMDQQVRNARAIITPTETVKKQLIEIYGKKYENKIQPLYEGVDYQLIRASNNPSNIRHLMSNVPFFIYVGNFYPHKNVERLIRAFAKVKTDFKLVLIGPDDFFANRLFQSVNKLKQTKKILFYHNPSREDMVFFYKSAKALIHPSLTEGFGLPLVEAMYFNLPIIASDIPVFKELLEDSYISFDAENTSDMEKKIEFFLKEKPQINYPPILKKYSFRKMAQETYSIYRKVMAI